MPTKKPTQQAQTTAGAGVKGDARKRRPGAQPGNINALRSGRRSKRLRKLIVALMSDPDIRSIVLALATAQEEDHTLRIDRALFLHRVAKLKQEMRRYGAIVDARS